MFKNGVFLLWGSGAPNGASGFDNTATLTASNGGFRLSVDGVNWTNVNVPTTAAQFFYNDGAAMS